jgi:hypothetical protein
MAHPENKIIGANDKTFPFIIISKLQHAVLYHGITETRMIFSAL